MAQAHRDHWQLRLTSEISAQRGYRILMSYSSSHQAHFGGRDDGYGGHRQPQVPRRRSQRHPAGDCRGRGHEVLREGNWDQCAEVSLTSLKSTDIV